MEVLEQHNTDDRCSPALRADLESSAKAKAQICFNLLTPDKAYPTLLYITFVTIKANPEITLSSLRKLMNREFLVPSNTVDSLVGGLVSTSLFGAVTKWWIQDAPNVIKLRAANPPSPELEKWLNDFCKQYPEMTYFRPVLVTQKSHFKKMNRNIGERSS